MGGPGSGRRAGGTKNMDGILSKSQLNKKQQRRDLVTKKLTRLRASAKQQMRGR